MRRSPPRTGRAGDVASLAAERLSGNQGIGPTRPQPARWLHGTFGGERVAYGRTCGPRGHQARRAAGRWQPRSGRGSRSANRRHSHAASTPSHSRWRSDAAHDALDQCAAWQQRRRERQAGEQKRPPGSRKRGAEPTPPVGWDAVDCATRVLWARCGPAGGDGRPVGASSGRATIVTSPGHRRDDRPRVSRRAYPCHRPPMCLRSITVTVLMQLTQRPHKNVHVSTSGHVASTRTRVGTSACAHALTAQP